MNFDMLKGVFFLSTVLWISLILLAILVVAILVLVICGGLS